MSLEDINHWMLATLLLSLRLSPVFALAPPFTLVRLPALFRMLFGLGLAACLATWHPAASLPDSMGAAALVAAAAGEMILGLLIVLAFQAMFAALYLAGRTIDVQAGFGLSLLIDPTTQSQTPLVGTLFAYAAGAVFFAMGGHLELLGLLGASLEAVPLGVAVGLPPVGRVGAFLSAVFLTAFGIAGGTILGLFLADLSVAMLSRTAPQLNVLVLGFQVKTILLLLLLPASFGAAGALFVRLVRLTLEFVPRLM